MDRQIEVKVFGNHLWKDANRAGVQGEGNVTTLRISFDEGWDGCAKSITFFDAKGRNPVKRTLTADLLEDIANSTLVYLCKIPFEPLAEAGWCSFVIDGTLEDGRQRSVETQLEVLPAKDGSGATAPAEPTPTQAEQLQAQIDTLLGDIQEQAVRAENAAKAAEASENAAETAEDSAFEHATEAAASAAAAEKSESAAARSASNAANSASSASRFANDAFNAMEDASRAVSDARGYMEGAREYAQNAATSEANVKLREANAAKWAGDAEQSATAAHNAEVNTYESASSAASERVAAEAAKAAAETAKDAAAIAHNKAEEAKADAESAKTAAATSEANAGKSATAAANSATTAANAANEAKGYRDEVAEMLENGTGGGGGGSGEPGKAGTTFTPSVDASGNLSWTNDGGLANPATVNIKGPAGYTPVKGKDYWTAADKQEIIQQATDALPTPDVSGQIGTHNTDTTAHSDIRKAANDAASAASDAQSAIDTHGTDTTKHITAAERSAWNAKLSSYTETDPTVPAWAKAASKPSYTASEVGADPKGTAASAVSAHNTNTNAHADLREIAHNAASWATSAKSTAEAAERTANSASEEVSSKAAIFYCYADETTLEEIDEQVNKGNLVVLNNYNTLVPMVFSDPGAAYGFYLADGSMIINATVDSDGWFVMENEDTSGEHTHDASDIYFSDGYTLEEKMEAMRAKIGEVELLADAWEGDGNLYSQIVSLDDVTEYSQVDLTPSVEQLVIFYEKDLTFVTENEDGVVTVYAIGQKPTNDYTIQVTITEVNV